MPAKRELSMRQLRHLLRLRHDGVSAREIGRRLGVARSTIQDNLKRAAAAPRTASTRSGPAKPTRTGQTGTPPTWWLNSQVKSCRIEITPPGPTSLRRDSQGSLTADPILERETPLSALGGEAYRAISRERWLRRGLQSSPRRPL